MKKIKILVVEDDPNRVVRFSRECAGHDLTVTEFASDGASHVRGTKFDLIFLDHDLGGQQMVDSDDNSGYHVAKAIPGSINDETPVVVHSLNPIGSQRMVGVLKNGYRISFTNLRISEVVSQVVQQVSPD